MTKTDHYAFWWYVNEMALLPTPIPPSILVKKKPMPTPDATSEVCALPIAHWKIGIGPGSVQPLQAELLSEIVQCTKLKAIFV